MSQKCCTVLCFSKCPRVKTCLALGLTHSKCDGRLVEALVCAYCHPGDIGDDRRQYDIFSSFLRRTVLVIKALKQHKPNLVSNPQQQESTLSANNGDLPESTGIKRTQLQSVVTNLRS